MPETRKLAAIMAVDVVGYSRLMGEDEAGTARVVREHRDAARPFVSDRGGRIVKTMGDGLLLEFPSVVDAVECAAAIQRLMVERNAETPESRRCQEPPWNENMKILSGLAINSENISRDILTIDGLVGLRQFEFGLLTNFVEVSLTPQKGCLSQIWSTA